MYYERLRNRTEIIFAFLKNQGMNDISIKEKEPNLFSCFSTLIKRINDTLPFHFAIAYPPCCTTCCTTLFLICFLQRWFRFIALNLLSIPGAIAVVNQIVLRIFQYVWTGVLCPKAVTIGCPLMVDHIINVSHYTLHNPLLTTYKPHGNYMCSTAPWPLSTKLFVCIF